MLRIGLTGGIGCGKTTVAERFALLGASIVDTDAIAHAQTAPGGPAMPAIVAQFGTDFMAPDGALDRARMRSLIFSDPAARERLEAILHPRIRIEAMAAANAARGAYVIFAVPLLVESGDWRERVQRVLVIDCPEETQIARVMARNNLPEEQVRAILASQASRAERLAAADDVIENIHGIEDLQQQIERLHHFYLEFSKRLFTMSSERL